MKLFWAVVLCTLAASYAEEHPRMVQLCGADLARAIKHVCEDGDLDFFNLQHVQHHHQHNHQDHQHDDHHGHHHEWKGQVMKRDTTASLADHCCAKPCHVKDFVSYCP